MSLKIHIILTGFKICRALNRAIDSCGAADFVYSFRMAAARKRTRTTKNNARGLEAGEFHLTLRLIEERKGERRWKTWMVQGWKENGKWKRKKFKKKSDAEAFRSRLQSELIKDQNATHRVSTRLTDDQIDAAEAAVKRLGERYTLTDAVDFFLQHFCEPEFKISVNHAKKKFLVGKEREGVRDRSLIQLQSTISRFESFVEDSEIHLITAMDVEKFLRSLRARNGVDKASRKTWNNYRADLSSFFNWCADSQRRWIANNPAAQVVKFKKIDRDLPEILSPKDALQLMEYVSNEFDGKMIRYFALALFAGIRTGPAGELHKLATHPELEKLIDLKRGIIHITPEISKTSQKRQIVIRPNLQSWLTSSPDDILPTNHDRMVKVIRREKGLGHDVLRHSFFSYHVGAFRSVGDAAIEGGNTESVVKKHYLNLSTRTEAEQFWNIGAPEFVRTEKRNSRLEVVV